MAQEGTACRILIADDSASDVFLVRRALDQQNFLHHLTVAQDGEEALLLLGQIEKGSSAEHPDIILLDLNLPKVAGDEILAYVRRTRAFDKTIVIVFTTSDSPQDRNLVRALGANVYFQKPTDLRSFMQLGQVIENLLRDAARQTGS